jgi:hypothetical protein
MGSLCSKASAHSGGHQVLGTAAQSNGQNYGTPSPPASDPRAAAREAAERRLKTVSPRARIVVIRVQDSPSRHRRKHEVLMPRIQIGDDLLGRLRLGKRRNQYLRQGRKNV